jgi:hypothetical protein
MTEQREWVFKTVEGYVAEDPEKYKAKSGQEYILVTLQGQKKKVALKPGFEGTYPRRGDHLVVEAAEGDAWWFARHRIVAVTPKDTVPAFDFMEKYGWKGRSADLAMPVMMWLTTHDDVTGNDVHDAIRRLAPKNDVRIIGSAFAYLAKLGVIERFGWVKSTRKESHYAPREAIWHLTAKWKAKLIADGARDANAQVPPLREAKLEK